MTPGEAKAKQLAAARARSKGNWPRHSMQAVSATTGSQLTQRALSVYKAPAINAPDNFHDMALLAQHEFQKLEVAQSALAQWFQDNPVTEWPLPNGGNIEFAYNDDNGNVAIRLMNADQWAKYQDTGSANEGLMLHVNGGGITEDAEIANYSGDLYLTSDRLYQRATSAASSDTGGTVTLDIAHPVRWVYGDYGAFWRHDGSTLYLMSTNAGDQYGGWNDYRPFIYTFSTGTVQINNLIGFTEDGYAIASDYEVAALENRVRDLEARIAEISGTAI